MMTIKCSSVTNESKPAARTNDTVRYLSLWTMLETIIVAVLRRDVTEISLLQESADNTNKL